MGLSWQQGPLAPGAVGRFLTPETRPERILFAEPLRRRMRVRFGGAWITDSEDAVLLHEPGRYPVAYFPLADITSGVLEDVLVHRRGANSEQTTCGPAARRASGARRAPEGTDRLRPEGHGRLLRRGRANPGHAADAYHGIDIRRTSRHLTVRSGDRVVADSERPLVLYDSGFAPRWYLPRADVDEAALNSVAGQTFCPHKGLASYYDIGGAHRAAWSYEDAFPEVGEASGMVSFEPDEVEVYLDGVRRRLDPGQNADRKEEDLTVLCTAGRTSTASTAGTPSGRADAGSFERPGDVVSLS